jgi:hypothetical protein
MPVTPEDFIGRVRRRVDAGMRDWALGDATTATLDLPLQPPSERDAINDLDGTLRWVESWRAISERLPISVTWTTRAWARLGTQRVPARARADGPDALASIAEEDERWERWTSRAASLRRHFSVAVDDVLRSRLREIGELDGSDFSRFVEAIEWLTTHPDSGLHVRELPVRGMDTKWLGRHRATVESMTLAVTGRGSLGLNERTDLGRIRLLDAAESVAGLHDISAPIDDLATLPLDPRGVLIVENLQTFLSLPPMPRVVAAYGQGNAVVALARVPWLRAARILYWGDLDSHGFRILHQARSAGLEARSVLMDSQCLYEHRDLWVAEPTPFAGTASSLTESETATLSELRSLGHVRLEQERIPWAYAIEELRRAMERLTR